MHNLQIQACHYICYSSRKLAVWNPQHFESINTSVGRYEVNNTAAPHHMLRAQLRVREVLGCAKTQGHFVGIGTGVGTPHTKV